MADESEYVAQLKEVYLSCDSSGVGQLNRRDLADLCEKLQLEDQAGALIERLVGNTDRCVGFEEFKDAFVLVLSSVVDTLDSTEDEVSTKDNGLASPKLGGAKKFGRDLHPDGHGADTPLDFPADLSDTEVSYASPSATPQPRTKRRHYSTPVNSNLATVTFGQDGAKRPRSIDEPSYSQADIFETEGLMSRSVVDHESVAVEAAEEEEHLRSIWKLLGVGTSGYLSVSELAVVCEHIGMETMNDEELKHLFDKLDADGDQRVSFDEFLNGLFQHGSSAKDLDDHRRQQSSTPIRSTSSQKRLVRLSSSLTLDGERGTMQTPSIFSAVFGSGFFSYVECDANGCAEAEEILQLWETFGVSRDDANAVLQALELDGSTRLKLQELSMALERELLTNDMDNAVYQVAVYSLRNELRHSRALSDAKRSEVEKLQQELDAARSRGNMLIKEAEERHLKLERALEQRVRNAELKHAEQLRAVQAEADGECEAVASAAAQQRLHWESAEARRREDELRTKEQLASAERNASRLEAELKELQTKCATFTNEIARLKRDLDVVPALRNQIHELEASREEINSEQNRNSRERLQAYENENKSLRDRNDELTVEVESMRQQLAGRGRRGRSGSHSRDSAAAVLKRQGSRMSDYPQKQRQPKESADDSSLSDEESTPAHIEQLQKTIVALQAKQEDAVRAAIASHEKEKKEQEKLFHSQLTSQAAELEGRQKEAVQKARAEEKSRAASQDLEWQRRLDSEKTQLRAEAQREQRGLVERHEAEKKKLLAAVSEQNEELRLLQASVTAEREATRLSHNQAIKEYEESLAKQGVGALHGRLREDFDRLVAQAVEEQRELEHQDAAASRQLDRAALQRRHEEQIDEVEQQMADLEQQMEDEMVAQRRRHEQQLAEMAQRAEDEKVAAEGRCEQRLAELQQQMEDEKEFLAEDIRSRMETEFIHEIEKIRVVFQEEREDYEQRLKAAHQELHRSKAVQAAAVQAADVGRLQRAEAEAAREDKLLQLSRQRDNAVLEKAKIEREVQRLRLEQEHARHSHDREVTALRRQLAEMRGAHSTHTSAAGDGRSDTGVSSMAFESVLQERQALLEDKDQLEKSRSELTALLQQSEDRAFELSTQLQLLESQRSREVQELKLRQTKMVEASALQSSEELLAAERQRREQLERALDDRAAESNRLLISTQEEHRLAMAEAEAQREALSRKLTVTRSALADVTQRLKSQLEKTTRSDYLVKDLYVENAQLMKALYITEQRQKAAEQAKYCLDDRRRALQDALLKICPTAIANV